MELRTGTDLKIQKDALYVVVADKLEDIILNDASMGVNHKLPNEQTLGETFGVSRPVVREALKLLNARGLITSRNGEGSFVCQPDYSMITDTVNRIVQLQNIDMKNVFEVRLTLESQAARLCALRIGEYGLTELSRINEQMSKSVPDYNARTELDLQFHQTIARESGNPILELFVDSMASLVFRMIRQTVDVADYSEDGVKEHTLLISALRAGDPDEAEKITRHHLEASFNKYNFRTQG